MYVFKTIEEIYRFDTTLEKCVKDFKNKLENPKIRRVKLQKIITCNVNTFRLSQLNHRNGVEHFFKNMNYYDQLTYDYLNYLHKSGLWEFDKEEELIWFAEKTK